MTRAEKAKRKKIWEMYVRNLLILLNTYKGKNMRLGMALLAANYGVLNDDQYSYVCDQIDQRVKKITLEGLDEWLDEAIMS